MNEAMPQGDVYPRFVSLDETKIRVCTPDDIEWMITVAREHYEGLFDIDEVRRWLAVRLKEPTMVFMRGPNSFGVAHTAVRFNAPTRLQGYMTFLYATAASGFETFRLLRALCDWTKARGATKFWIGDTTGRNLGAFAQRLGGRLAGHTYVVDLDDNPNPLG